MAQSLHDIKDKIVATQNMSKITNAMKMVATSKLAKSEAKVKTHRDYMASLDKLVQKISGDEAVKSHPFLQVRKNPNIGYLVLTSDRGLAGGFNGKVLKLLEATLEKKSPDQYRLYMIGSKGFDFGKRHNWVIHNDYRFVPDEFIYGDIQPVIEQIIGDYLAGKIQQVVVIYNDFVSKLVQEPTQYQLLPLTIKASKERNNQHIFEPSAQAIIDNLLPKYVEGILYGCSIASKVSEFASRMNAMQNATDNAGDIVHELQLIYNRARQAAITQEINEIVGGAQQH